MAEKIGYVQASLCVPDFNLMVALSTRQKHHVICWIETDGPHNCLMTRQGDLKTLTVAWLLQVRADKQLDESVIGPSGDESLSPGPVDTVYAAHVVVLLPQDHVDVLYLS